MVLYLERVSAKDHKIFIPLLLETAVNPHCSWYMQIDVTEQAQVLDFFPPDNSEVVQ